MKRALRVARVLWVNRKSEVAVTLAVISIGREIVQAATGH